MFKRPKKKETKDWFAYYFKVAMPRVSWCLMSGKKRCLFFNFTLPSIASPGNLWWSQQRFIIYLYSFYLNCFLYYIASLFEIILFIHWTCYMGVLCQYYCDIACLFIYVVTKDSNMLFMWSISSLFRSSISFSHFSVTTLMVLFGFGCEYKKSKVYFWMSNKS